jgi:peroxiredoxin
MDLIWAVVAVAALAVLLVNAFALGGLLYRIVRQRGLTVRRLDDLQAYKLTPSQRGPNARDTHASEVPVHPPSPQALSVGTALDRFRLRDLTGRQIDSDDMGGRRVLLVNWNPRCAFCDLIASDLATLQDSLKRANVELLLVTYGEAERNRELAERQGFKCPILLQPDGYDLPAFRGLGTPVAYLFDEHGRVAMPLAVGADEVPILARQAAGLHTAAWSLAVAM